MHVEQGEAVHQGVLGGPLPGLGDGVQARGERAAGEHGTLGRPGGAAGVDDERRGPGVRLWRRAVGAGEGADVEHRDGQLGVGLGVEQEFGAGVGEQVADLGGPGVGGDGDHRHPGEEAAEYPGDGVRGGPGEDGQAGEPGHPVGHRPGSFQQFVAGDGSPGEGDGGGGAAVQEPAEQGAAGAVHVPTVPAPAAATATAPGRTGRGADPSWVDSPHAEPCGR